MLRKLLWSALLAAFTSGAAMGTRAAATRGKGRPGLEARERARRGRGVPAQAQAGPDRGEGSGRRTDRTTARDRIGRPRRTAARIPAQTNEDETEEEREQEAVRARPQPEPVSRRRDRACR